MLLQNHILMLLSEIHYLQKYRFGELQLPRICCALKTGQFDKVIKLIILHIKLMSQG